MTEPRRFEDWRPAGLLAGILAGLSGEDREMFKPILELPAASQIDFLG